MTPSTENRRDLSAELFIMHASLYPRPVAGTQAFNLNQTRLNRLSELVGDRGRALIYIIES